jgi:Ca2+-binding RTX toxin-like protein
MAVIPGTAGDDVQTGTADDDRILASGGADTIDGLEGFDTIDYRAAPAGIIVVPTGMFPPIGTSADDSLVFDGFGAFDHVIGGVEGILGSSFRDVIEGNAFDNLFFGFDGDDLIRGGSGNDELDGGRGNDTLDGEEGFDTLRGRSGDDVLIGGEGGGDTMLGGDGDDTLAADGDDPVVMRGNAGNDAMSFVGQLGNPQVFGDGGNDVAVIVNDDGGRLSGGLETTSSASSLIRVAAPAACRVGRVTIRSEWSSRPARSAAAAATTGFRASSTTACSMAGVATTCSRLRGADFL